MDHFYLKLTIRIICNALISRASECLLSFLFLILFYLTINFYKASNISLIVSGPLLMFLLYFTFLWIFETLSKWQGIKLKFSRVKHYYLISIHEKAEDSDLMILGVNEIIWVGLPSSGHEARVPYTTSIGYQATSWRIGS